MAAPLLACIDVPSLPLQLLLRREPAWRAGPAAVVASDRAQGIVLYVNEHARRLGVAPSFTYAAGLAIASDLRAAVVTNSEIADELGPLDTLFRRYSPHVEPSADEPGVAWLDARGLQGLYPSLVAWGRAILGTLAARELEGAVAIGFTRFGTYAAARARRGAVRLFDSPSAEAAATRGAPLKLLGIAPRIAATLDRLGLGTVGDLLALPIDGLRRRYGDELWRLREWAAGTREMPIRTATPAEPLVAQRLIDDGLERSDQILRVVEKLLLPLLDVLEARSEGLALLVLTLAFERSEARREEIRPATASLDASQILGLVLLRLEASRLAEPVTEIALEAVGARRTSAQGELFAERPARDLAAAERALARVRARFGEASVQRALLNDAHLPEAQLGWAALAPLTAPEARAVRVPTLVRRCYSPPRPLAPRSRHEPDGWILNGPEAGSVARMFGPYIITGGWWGRASHREYYFAETRRGSFYWVYYDRELRRWFLHGVVT